MPSVRVFNYVDAIDSFIVTEEYRYLADYLGLTEWHPVVWIGRLFALDNDYGEHWFDNWEEREAAAARAAELGIDASDLMIVRPDRLANGYDGPCHSSEVRKRFWTDVLKSLELSYELLFEKARETNARMKKVLPDEYIDDLERRIHEIGQA
jgi:hypothetical protein